MGDVRQPAAGRTGCAMLRLLAALLASRRWAAAAWSQRITGVPMLATGVLEPGGSEAGAAAAVAAVLGRALNERTNRKAERLRARGLRPSLGLQLGLRRWLAG